MLKKILKNSSYLLMAQGIAKVVSFFYTLFLARNLGVENFGLYIVALSYFSLVSSVADLGVNQYLIREGSTDHERLNHLLAGVALFRLAVTSFVFGSLAVILYLTDPHQLRVSLVLIATLAALPQSIALTLDSAFVALQKLPRSAFGLLILSFSTALSGILLVKSGASSFAPVIALVLGEIIYAAINFINIKNLRVKIISSIDKALLKRIVLGGLPYGLLGVLGLLYFKIDSLILNYLKGDYATGIYGAAYKFLEAVVFVPSAFQAALFPVLARMEKPGDIFPIYLKSTLALFGLSLVVVLGYFTLLPQLIIHFLPQYQESLSVIRIITLTIPFLFMIAPQSIIFMSHKTLLKDLIIISVFNLSLNIVLNFILIPQYSYIGSSVVTVISDVVSFSIFFVYIWKKFRPAS